MPDVQLFSNSDFFIQFYQYYVSKTYFSLMFVKPTVECGKAYLSSLTIVYLHEKKDNLLSKKVKSNPNCNRVHIVI